MKQKLTLYFLGAAFFLIPLITNAQNRGVRLGEWRVHLPYERCHHITENADKLFAASTLGFFSYNKNDGSLERLSSINGFADGEVSVMEYDPQTDKLWIAYANTKIDVLKKQKINTLNDIFRSTLPGNKTIHHIYFANRLAYISTGIGIIVYDQDRMEVKENYLNLQNLGSQSSAIYATCILRDTLYAATGNGIIYGKISPQINLADFTNWQRLDSSKGSYHLSAFNGKLFAERDSLLQVWDGNQWSEYFTTPVGKVNSIRVHQNKLVICMDNLVEIQKPDNSLHRMQKNGTVMGLVSSDDYFWYVTAIDGMVRVNRDSSEFFYKPNGPNANTAFRMLSYNNAFWATAGAYSPEFIHTYNFAGYNIFKNNEWIRNPYFSTLRRVHDYTVMAKHPFENKLYIGTHGKGVLEFTGETPTNWFNRSNSTLNYFDNGAGDSLYFCSGMAFDPDGNLWVTNYGVDSALHVYTADKKWKALRLPTSFVGELVIDAAQNKWIIMPRPNLANGAICVYNDNKTPLEPLDDTVRILTTQNAGLPTNLVRCLAIMPNNELWVGTDAGLVVFRNPSNAFGIRPGNPPLNAERIIIEQDGVGGYLLGAEVIYSITVDGGGRRWVGTNKGAWLIGKNGQDILANFNKDNSPLPTDNVLNIGIDEQSGEVFFGTDKGLFSFKGQATLAETQLQKLKIFPNPVRETFDGEVAIDGLTQDARVKITDINGMVVYETVSNGGRATWNCRTFSGARPTTGVYLVFAIRSDGQESIVGKILFVK